MKADNVGEESLGDGLGEVRVSKQDEVGILAEPVDHGEDDRLASHAREHLDEVTMAMSDHTPCDTGRGRSRLAGCKCSDL
jgi:hypothetical protein